MERRTSMSRKTTYENMVGNRIVNDGEDGLEVIIDNDRQCKPSNPETQSNSTPSDGTLKGRL